MLNLSHIDIFIICVFLVISLLIGLRFSKQASEDSSSYFLSNRNMPWWLLGISMVATTFSADTPNLVTDIVRTNGVSGNWVWWAFLLTGMLTVFIYAKLWRRSGILTDLEFYEMRYSGKPAAFLRGFRAIYLGVIFNVIVMSAVCLAGIKIGAVLLGLTPIQTLLITSVFTVAYSALGGLKGIIYNDFFQFGLAMLGTIFAAIYLIDLPEVKGLENLLASEAVAGKLNILPDLSNRDTVIGLLVVPLAVQWWATYYPGAEPGGGGYIAQRMLAAKDEKNAMGATLLFNIAHYALRPWPWIIIALCSLLLFPMDSDTQRTAAAEKLKSGDYKEQVIQYQKDPTLLDITTRAEIRALQFQKDGLTSLRAAFPDNTVPDNKIGHDLAFPAMIGKLPPGLLGLLIASLIAAFMSTISTHLNWGSSYLANDVYKRFVKPEATDKELVHFGRICTVMLMIMAAIFALFLENAKQIFDIILLIGSGTGLIFILRWFWWRINAYSEISAMIISFFVAFILEFTLPKYGVEMQGYEKLLIGIGVTTAGWILVTLLTAPTEKNVLFSFYKKIKPSKNGWRPVIEQAKLAGYDLQIDEVKDDAQIGLGLFSMLLGCLAVYATLFATGYWIYGLSMKAILFTAIAAISFVILLRNLRKF